MAVGREVDWSKKESKVEFTPNPNNQAEFDAFKAMAGTDNVRPFLQMVAQNHVDLGEKVPIKIIVYSNGQTTNGIAGPDIAIQLGRFEERRFSA